MALIKCNECGNAISEYADYCIHCGAPPDDEQSLIEDMVELNRKQLYWLRLIGIIVAIEWFTALIYFFVHR